ncbi:autophagy protein Apg5 [Colletotrichum costaricense]|uniref:Autophagy protein 5 n=2 Tax=Colletotrichum acutatum species complex TaxID=2707335 RepID=A0AAI9Z0L1_9PEZI|nr:autophagy protein Apg5 [Colletotrichum costaricense]XP_060388648.1 autophagy protein Apg5 [Colletotrichum tamarilloi]KAI3549055.1 autophagy protein Apg5 [Colletotrichum filicis]KAK1512213.1 autophagy protein Apg5 [Colletotrichum tamarilloi]KAK1530393.1 autophagy protein Apg5 [Colletotrichum costaricense]
MSSIPQTLWSAQIPLHIIHPSAPNTPLVTSLPRFSYLALLVPRCSAFFRHPVSAFHHEDLLLRNLPLGLLVDLYQPTLPWRLTVSDGDSWDIGDTFLNCVKEADFVRYGNAKRIMSLSKADTSSLWNAVQDNDYASFAKINALLLNAPTPLRNVPLRVYIPSSPPPGTGSNTVTNTDTTSPPPTPAQAGDTPGAGAFKVLQTLVPPVIPGTRTRQTLGRALQAHLPSLFPSSRDPILANVVLHGSPVPFSAPLEDLMREAAYPDGWLCLAVVLL